MQSANLTELNKALTVNAVNIDLNKLLPITGGLTDGYIGKIIDVAYVDAKFTLTNKQTIEIPGSADIVIPAGDNALSLSIVFADNSSVALSVLRRSAKSKINNRCGRDYSFPELLAFKGQTLTVLSSSKDSSTEKNFVSKGKDGSPITKTTFGKEYLITIL